VTRTSAVWSCAARSIAAVAPRVSASTSMVSCVLRRVSASIFAWSDLTDLRVVLSDRDDELRVEPAQSLVNRLDRLLDVDRLNLDVDRAILLQLGQVAERLGRVDPG
jgi:hypothetical protein